LLNVDIKQYIFYFKFISKFHISIFSKAFFIKAILSSVFICFKAKGVLKDISNISQLLKILDHNNHIVSHHLTQFSFKVFINFSVLTSATTPTSAKQKAAANNPSIIFSF